MSIDVGVAVVGVRIPLSREHVKMLAMHVVRAERVKDALLSITFVTDAEIARLNREHLGHRGPTDVISFGLRTDVAGAPTMGDVYIGVDEARRNARLARVTVREELMRLVVHGVLHVLGHDHPDGEARLASDMWRRQERYLARFGGAAA